MTVGPPSKVKPFLLKTLALPPKSLCFSINVTLCPFALSLRAAAIPPKPEPITTEFIKFNFILFLRKVTKLSNSQELIFLSSDLASSRFFSNKLSSFDLSTEVDIIFLTELIAILIDVSLISLMAASFI